MPKFLSDLQPGEQADFEYSPANQGDWNANLDPGGVDEALDQLASRMTTLEGSSGGGDASNTIGTDTVAAGTSRVYVGPVTVTGVFVVNGYVKVI